ncbi:MAG: hypothetical protein IJZ29_00755 [Clostridia bacterium]|nr:hypothetical protein [Clostridia bacterium]
MKDFNMKDYFKNSPISIVLMLAFIAFNAVVIMCMWNWFIVPLGAVQIGYWIALGIAFIVKAVTTHKVSLIDFVMSLFIWGIGAIVQFWI